MGECFSRGTATFLLLGPECTRNCRFCNVSSGRPGPPDPSEPENIAGAVREMGLKYIVLTMVTRDDLEDGGAEHVAETVRALKKMSDEIRVEALISDLRGDPDSLEKTLKAEPDVLNHNIETVPRLYSRVRPQADYARSLKVLSETARLSPGTMIKSGLMVGLGETGDEVTAVLSDLKNAGCEAVTIGQYLAPSASHFPVARYIHPDEFNNYANKAAELGFKGIASGPFVRSSYRAALMFENASVDGGAPFILTPC